MSQAEFDAILQDTSKIIQTNIVWQKHPQHERLLKFKAEIISASAAYQLSLRGTYNPILHALSYHIICPPYGRIYGLDMGKDHKNPDGQLVGEKHKHRWSESYRDKQAYLPQDITAAEDDPVGVWQQFCEEALIRHNGIMRPPPPLQLGLF
ncbi:hypothetical protein IQ241_14560 [Romeria aff. gracilis LEGE 07310]|uniref:Uncharacterized protein n=1 Tax=Vasconcelosia minhoensis LEGE 07310 TaxID=915328 RepID=A0A8J7APY8_9CYAN|nr:hypothetical protein [Romeria gracilis]MBE9078504.1 hypothetical protein [Romeria aff. gracilis LEGE 07310]